MFNSTSAPCTCYLGIGCAQHIGNTGAPIKVTSISSDSTMPATVWTWTWTEALAVALRAPRRASVYKRGERWVVTWRATPMLYNAATVA